MSESINKKYIDPYTDTADGETEEHGRLKRIAELGKQIYRDLKSRLKGNQRGVDHTMAQLIYGTEADSVPPQNATEVQVAGMEEVVGEGGKGIAETATALGTLEPDALAQDLHIVEVVDGEAAVKIVTDAIDAAGLPAPSEHVVRPRMVRPSHGGYPELTPINKNLDGTNDSDIESMEEEVALDYFLGPEIIEKSLEKHIIDGNSNLEILEIKARYANFNLTVTKLTELSSGVVALLIKIKDPETIAAFKLGPELSETIPGAFCLDMLAEIYGDPQKWNDEYGQNPDEAPELVRPYLGSDKIQKTILAEERHDALAQERQKNGIAEPDIEVLEARARFANFNLAVGNLGELTAEELNELVLAEDPETMATFASGAEMNMHVSGIACLEILTKIYGDPFDWEQKYSQNPESAPILLRPYIETNKVEETFLAAGKKEHKKSISSIKHRLKDRNRLANLIPIKETRQLRKAAEEADIQLAASIRQIFETQLDMSIGDTDVKKQLLEGMLHSSLLRKQSKKSKEKVFKDAHIDYMPFDATDKAMTIVNNIKEIGPDNIVRLYKTLGIVNLQRYNPQQLKYALAIIDGDPNTIEKANKKGISLAILPGIGGDHNGAFDNPGQSFKDDMLPFEISSKNDFEIITEKLRSFGITKVEHLLIAGHGGDAGVFLSDKVFIRNSTLFPIALPSTAFSGMKSVSAKVKVIQDIVGMMSEVESPEIAINSCSQAKNFYGTPSMARQIAQTYPGIRIIGASKDSYQASSLNGTQAPEGHEFFVDKDSRNIGVSYIVEGGDLRKVRLDTPVRIT